jgi:hypothetical protein
MMKRTLEKGHWVCDRTISCFEFVLSHPFARKKRKDGARKMVHKQAVKDRVARLCDLVMIPEPMRAWTPV